MTDFRDPDPDLAAELRSGPGREWAEDAAEDERLTELLRRRRLHLKDVMRDFAHRGARVSVDAGGHSFSGVLIAAGDDYGTLEGAGQVTEVRYEAGAWSVIVIDRGTPEEPILNAVTFKARLHEHAAARTRIQLGLEGGLILTGVVGVVAADHLEFIDVDERRFYVPLNRILGASRSIDPH
ncbi:MAG: hypothetical protein ACE5F5_01445 [Acidimicrobiia bacterium]